MRLRFRKLRCSAEADVLLKPNTGGGWIVDQTDLEAAIKAELARVHDEVGRDPEAFKYAKNAFENVRVPEAALALDATYQTFLRTLRTPVVLIWKWDTRFTLEPTDDPSRVILSCMFANDSPRQLSPTGKDQIHIEYSCSTPARNSPSGTAWSRRFRSI